MATSEILGLFASPQQYEQQRQAAMEAQALRMAELNPMQQGQYGIALGAQQLGRAIGGALGGVDPQLQKITQRQQLLGMIDPSNPDSYAKAIQAALQTGDQEAAFLLRNEMMKAKEQSAVAEVRGFEREKYLLERGEGIKQRSLESRALSIANGIDPDTGLTGKSILNEQGEVIDTQALKPLIDPTTNKFNQDVANTLISQYGQVGANIVKQRLEGVQGIESLQEKQLARNRVNKANELFSKLKKPDGTIDEAVKEELLASPEGRALITQQAEVLKPLRQLGAAGTPEEDPFKIFIDDASIPANVKTLATQYSTSFAKGMIDPDKVDARVKDLTDMTQRIQQFDQNQAQIKTNQESMAAMREQNLQNSQAYLALAQSQLALSRQNAAFQQRMKLDEATAKAEKAKDGKEIKFGDATKLAGQSTGVDNLVGIYEAFKPEFAGFGTNAIGEVAVFAAGKQSDEKSVALYQWWQDYQNNINKVRNDLFGSALTAPEKAEFEKAMVTKGMNSAQAEKNLRRQAELAQKAYNKIDNVLRVQGYSKAALDALKPNGIKPPMSSFVIERDNTNPSGITGGKR